MKYFRFLFFCFFGISVIFRTVAGAKESGALFPTRESEEQFASEVSVPIEKAWKAWQDSVRIEEIDVEGGRGFLMPGEMSTPILTLSDMMKFFDRKNKTQEYISAVRAVLEAVENGMRAWQIGYTHTNIPFPCGASCLFTMTPSNNVPVVLSSGESFGDKMMTVNSLYGYMLYRAPKDDASALRVLRSSAEALSECFDDWKSNCFIVGIMASGGIAPHPAMGTGPGPVRGAKGKNGKLKGAYFDGAMMKKKMIEYRRADLGGRM